MTNLNEQQQKAVESNEKNIVVAASAGTGKTTVLVERVLRKILNENIDLNRMLILTFTEAAAENMKNRLEKALREEKEKNDADKARIDEQLEQLQTANISTIDAFINKLVQKYSYNLGIDPEYKILNSDIAKQKLRNQAYDQVINNFSDETNQDRQLLFQLMTENNEDKNLKKALFKFYEFLGSLEDKDSWIEKNAVSKEEFKQQYFGSIFGFIKTNRGRIQKLSKYLDDHYVDRWEQIKPLLKATPQKVINQFIVYKPLLDKLSHADNFDEIKEILSSLDMSGISKISGFGNSTYKGIPVYLTDMVNETEYMDKSLGEIGNCLKRKKFDNVKFQQELESFNERLLPLYEKMVSEIENTDYEGEEYGELAAKKLKNITEGKQQHSERLKICQEISEFFANEAQSSENKLEMPTFPKKYFSDSLDTKDAFLANNLDILAFLYTKMPSNIEEILEQQIGLRTEFLNLYRDFVACYEKIKQQQNVFEYSDLSKKALELLKEENSPAVSELQNRLDEIIIDEYQDTNRLQESIFQTIAGDKVKRFSVGDAKQSIYAFRQADYTVFLEKIKSADDKSLITLETNYRSRQPVIAEINKIFGNIMTEENDGIDYQKERIAYGNGYEDYEALSDDEKLNPFEIVALEKGQDLTGSETQAKEIVNRIRQMMKEKKVYDRKKKSIRKMEYRDFAIISRSWTHSEDYLKALKLAGIPYKVSRSDQFLEKPEIRIAVSYLKALTNTRDDIAIVALLHSPLYGLNERELAFMRTLQKGSFYGLVHKTLKEDDEKLADEAAAFGLGGADFINSLAAKLEKFKHDFELLHSLAYTTKPSDLVSYMLGETVIVSVFQALPQGEARRANLNGLANYVRELEEDGITSLSEITDVLTSNKDGKLDEINENTDDNVVSFTTIHGSKGLEFPVVFLIETQGSGKSNNSNNVIFNRQDGMFFKELKVSDLGNGIKEYEIDGEFLKSLDLNDEEELEKKRLLYVALTRTEQSLQILACKSDKNDKNSYLSMISQGEGIKTEFSPSDFPADSKNEAKNRQAETDPAFDGKEFVYAHQVENQSKLISPATDVKGNFSASDEIEWSKHYAGEKEEQEQIVSADELGTAVHLIFERLNLAKVSEKDVQKEAADLCDQGFFSRDVLDVINEKFVKGIASLYQTNVGQKLCRSTNVKREFPVNVLIKASQDEDDDFSIVHGIIDAMFFDEEENAWTLLDYKTDINLDGKKVKEEHYDGQLRLYAQALEAMGEKVSACFLYGVRHNDLFKIGISEVKK